MVVPVIEYHIEDGTLEGEGHLPHVIGTESGRSQEINVVQCPGAR